MSICEPGVFLDDEHAFMLRSYEAFACLSSYRVSISRGPGYRMVFPRLWDGLLNTDVSNMKELRPAIEADMYARLECDYDD